jgi:hypothetical protein
MPEKYAFWHNFRHYLAAMTLGRFKWPDGPPGDVESTQAQ